MAILTEEQLKARKEEARKEEIRQNVKNHCTKIRDGICNNGTTSGERAIWELFQNARDLSDSAEIEIRLTNTEFIFAHKGRTFTFDSLCSLVKQVSSEEKENDNSVGQYGTGFLTTHKFSRKITIKGSMLISDNPKVYVDIPDFEINRENYNNIPTFINDMTNQIKAVEDLMDTEQKSMPREWTELHYELNEERFNIALNAIEQAIKLMPYVLTFNDHISKCVIEYQGHRISFQKEDKATNIEDLKCKHIEKDIDGKTECIECYYLELDNGESRILLPLKSETDVYDLGDIPKLFVYFPLIGENHFNVNFLFHSHRFIPKEKRDNIIVPKDDDATSAEAVANKAVLDKMVQYLWLFLEAHIHTWNNTILLATINIKDCGFDDKKTEDYYKNLKEDWVNKFQKLKLIEINGKRYSMNDEIHPLVLEPSLEQFLSYNKDKGYLDTIYPYANGAGLIPCKEELLQWSNIIGSWNKENEEYFLSLENIVKYVSKEKGYRLHDMLKMLVDAGKTDFFSEYELIPNREGILKTSKVLYDAKTISPKLYRLVKDIDSTICEKMVDIEYQDIIALHSYNRQTLRTELNEVVKAKENEYWKAEINPRPYEDEFEKSIIALCSSFTIENGDSKRNRLMPIICRFEGIKDYHEIHIPAADDDSEGFDLYRQIFISLVENQMMKICRKDKQWVADNMQDLVDFVNFARGDDYKFCTHYAIYPNMNGDLHLPEELKKNQNVADALFNFYEKVKNDDLRDKCVDCRFEGFFPKYREESYQYTSQNVAQEIQNQLSTEDYQNIILLDIIELTERENEEDKDWRSWFKDIYDRRESIRYKLGTDEERKAINRMMKQNKPELLTKMAEISEKQDANIVLDKINETIDAYEKEKYIKMLGEYVEKNVQQFIKTALDDTGISVRNEQGGQDLILSKPGFEDYYIEIKSRWQDKDSAIMSTLQFQKAVANPLRYSLISAQMWNFDRKRAINDEPLQFAEMESLLRVCDNIGSLEADLKKRVDEAFKGDISDIRIVGSYDVCVPQKVFNTDFTNLVSIIKSKFA